MGHYNSRKQITETAFWNWKVDIFSPILRHKGLRSLVGIPLSIQQSGIRVLHIGTFQSHKFTQRDVQQLQLIANLIGFMTTDARVFNFTLSLIQIASRGKQLATNPLYQAFRERRLEPSTC